MATGKRFYWMRLKTNFMTSDTIDYFMSQKDGANYVVLYQMLCLKTIQTGGRLARQIGEVIIPYDVDKIVRDCKWFSADTVRVALNLYKAFGLIYEESDGVLAISDYAELVGSETDWKAQKALQREKKKAMLLENGTECGQVHTDVHTDVLQSVHTEIEIEKEIDNISSPNGEDCPEQIVQDVPTKKGGRKKAEPIPHDHKAYKSAKWLDKRICERMPKRKPCTEADLQRWAKDIDKINRIDGYEWEDISDVLMFSQRDKFWQANILSGDALRRNFEKLMAQENRTNAD